MNPYHIRNAVRDDRYFFGRRRDLADIQALVGAQQPQSIAIVGDRRIGKSSLLHAVYRKLRCAPGTLVIYQDVRGYHTDVEFFDGIASQLAASAHVDLPAGRSSADVLRRTVAQFCRGRNRIVMLLDEFDAIAKNASFPVTFFNFLRSLPNSWPVSLVLTSASKLRDTCHSEEIAGSPFFNIFHERRLGCFKREESLELIRRPSAEAGVPLQPIEEKLLDLAGDWPFFLQVACYWALAEAPAAGGAWDMARVHARVYEDLRGHLAHLWKQLTDKERYTCARAVSREPLTTSSPGTIDSLVTRGILARSARGLDVSCQLVRTLVSGQPTPLDTHPGRIDPHVVKVFVSYSRQDSKLVDNLGLLGYISALANEGVSFWRDTRLTTGDLWDEKIRWELKRADIALLLVSHSYLQSPYCQKIEVREFLKARATSGLVIFPVILSPCEWERFDWLRSTQFLPTKGTITTHYAKKGRREQFFLEILKELRTVAERVREARAHTTVSPMSILSV